VAVCVAIVVASGCLNLHKIATRPHTPYVPAKIIRAHGAGRCRLAGGKRTGERKSRQEKRVEPAGLRPDGGFYLNARILAVPE
jgi:hypothetical protein